MSVRTDHAAATQEAMVWSAGVYEFKRPVRWSAIGVWLGFCGAGLCAVLTFATVGVLPTLLAVLTAVVWCGFAWVPTRRVMRHITYDTPVRYYRWVLQATINSPRPDRNPQTHQHDPTRFLPTPQGDLT